MRFDLLTKAMCSSFGVVGNGVTYSRQVSVRRVVVTVLHDDGESSCFWNELGN